MDPETIWQEVLENLKKEVSQETYELWLKPVRNPTIVDDTFILEVPNKFFAEWINNNFKEKIIGMINSQFDKKTPNIDFRFYQDDTQETQEMPQTKWTSPPTLPQQYPFNPKYTFEEFVVGDSNRFSHAACYAVAQNPSKSYNPLFIYGGVGLGKTHLLHAIGNFITKNHPYLKILYTTSEKFINEFIDSLRFENLVGFRKKFHSLDCLLIDDIQFLMGKERSEEEFFFTFNTLFDSQKQIVITSDRPPSEITALEDRLISRFQWGVVADIQPPAFETRVAILRKLADNQDIFVGDDVINYIATHIKSNIRQLEGCFTRVVAYTKLTQNLLTIDSVKTVLKDVLEKEMEYKPVKVEDIQQVVAKRYNIDIKELLSKKRSDEIAFPRQLTMYLIRNLTDLSTVQIGEIFNRDHTTVMYACEKIREKLETDPFFSALVNKIIDEIKKYSQEE